MADLLKDILGGVVTAIIIKLLKGGHAEHIHANCDCEFAVRFDGSTTVAGYDPEKYLRQYRAAGSDVNAMRRIDYAAHRERINAQKRAAYAARKGSTESEKSTTIIYQQFDEALKTDVRIADDGTESFSIFMELGTAEKKTFRTVW